MRRQRHAGKSDRLLFAQGAELRQRLDRQPEKGNTEVAAEFVQKAVGGDLFEVEPVKDYAADYAACTEEARAELRANARPALKRYLDSLDGYDTVFVCGPCWWGTFPMAVFSLLERLDFAGKKCCR